MIYFCESKNQALYENFIDTINKGSEIIEYEVNNKNIMSIVNELISIGLFNTDKLYILDSIDFFTNKTSKISKKYHQPFIDALNRTTFDIVILIKKKVSIDNKYYLSLNNDTKYVLIEDSDNAKNVFLSDIIKFYNIDISKNDLNYLKENLDNDLLNIKNELIKLSTYNKNITKQTIDELSYKTSKANSFILINYIIDGKLSLASTLLLRLLEEGNDVFSILGLCQSSLNFYIAVKVQEGMSDSQIAKNLNANPYRIKMVKQTISSANIRKLFSLHSKIADFDFLVKGGRINPELFLEFIQ